MSGPLTAVTGGPFPDQLDCKVRYQQVGQLSTSAAGGLLGTEQRFRLNSIYDPDYTGVGHQPYYHDTLATIYGQYLVLGVEMKWTITDPSSDGLAVAFQMNGSTQGVSTITGATADLFGEYPHSCLRQINDSGSQVVVVSQKVNPWALEGIPKEQYLGNDLYRADFGSSPSKILAVAAAAVNVGTSSTQSVSYTCELIYHVRCYSRKNVAQS